MHKTRAIAMAVTLAALAALLSSCGTATGIAAVVAGDAFSCARLDDGRVACWGTNARGQTGTGTSTGSVTPVAVPGLDDTVDVAAGAAHACAVGSGGAVRCWGANDSGQVGDGSTTDALVPVPVAGATDVVGVAAGGAHTCALTSNGSVRCWGANDHGQIGDGTTADATTPQDVPGLTDVVALTAGEAHSCALRSDASLRCWGANDRGQLGDGTTTDATAPQAVAAVTGVSAVAAGSAHTCAAAGGGTLRCWGANDRGQLGDGTTTDATTPQEVPGLVSATAVGLGREHSCAVAGGALRCWGANDDGQVADTPGDALTPVAVAGASGVTAIDAGADHTCARTDPEGEALCWGAHDQGQLGRGTAPGGSTPTPVAAVTEAPVIVGAVPTAMPTGAPIAPVLITATGSGTVVLAHTGGTVPPGLVLDASVPGELTLSGTPTTEGSYAFTITGTNGTPPDATRTFTVEVGTAPVIATSLPTATPVRLPVDLHLTATGTGPATWTSSGDPLPAGLVLQPDGHVTGTPTTVGTATGTLTVTTPFGSDSVPFSIEVTAPVITTIVGPGPDSGPATAVAGPSGGIALDGTELFVSSTEVPTIRRVDLATGQQQRVAGDYIRRVTPLPAPATQSSFTTPLGSTVGPDGALYFATSSDHRVLRLADDGTLSLFASITNPTDIVFDSTGAAFIYSLPGRIWKVPAGGGAPALIAGNGTCSHTGNGGPASAATVCPGSTRLAIGPDDSLYLDGGSYVRKIATDGTITALPGDAPGQITAITATTGEIYVARWHQVFRNDAGSFVRVAGAEEPGFAGDGGPAMTARFGQITDLEHSDDGALYALDGNDNFRVRRIVVGGAVTTVAGNGFKHASGDGGPATSAQVLEAGGATYDDAGSLYYADRQSRIVRKVAPDGTITTVAGTGANCSVPSTCVTADGQLATSVALSTPEGLAVDDAGDLYVVDQVGLIWRITPDGVMHRFAGGGGGTGTFTGDGGPATAARFANPTDVAISPTGEVYIADYFNNRIRKVDAGGIVTTVAGSGPDGFSGSFAGDGGPATSAKLNLPRSMAFDADGNLYIGDLMNHRVRKVTPSGVISTVAGTGVSGGGGDGGPATAAGLNRPYDVAVTAAGDLLIADAYNRRIRRVDTSGTITTVAGTGVSDYAGDGGLATNARMHLPVCLAVDADGGVAVCDTLSWRIRKISPL